MEGFVTWGGSNNNNNNYGGNNGRRYDDDGDGPRASDSMGVFLVLAVAVGLGLLGNPVSVTELLSGGV